MTNIYEIDFAKILPNNLEEEINMEKLIELKEIADKRKGYIGRRYTTMRTSRAFVSNKGYEYAYTSSEMSNKTNEEKALITSNIAFTDKEFANIINNSDFDKERLENYIIMLNNYKLNPNNTELLKLIKRETKNIIDYFLNMCGIIKPIIIINKIIEILTYNPNLLRTKGEKIIENSDLSNKKTLYNIDALDAIYYYPTKIDDKIALNFTFVCNCDNIVKKDLKQLYEIIEKLSAICKSKKVIFVPTVSSADHINELIRNKDEEFILQLEKSEIIYSKDHVLSDGFNSIANKKIR